MPAAPAARPRSSRPTSTIRYSRSAKASPTSINTPSQEFEKALRAKYDFSLFYPRAVNQMRMLAAATDKAKSTDPVKVALALEGMEFEVFNGGKGNMRKDDHQFFQPMYISSLGDRTEKEPFDEEKTGWGWKLVAKIDTAADRAADHLQDGTAELTVRA